MLVDRNAVCDYIAKSGAPPYTQRISIANCYALPDVIIMRQGSMWIFFCLSFGNKLF